ncbi:MAG: c-type cytochrome [bacterium]
MNALKMIGFSLAVIGFYSWYANYIPQIESHPPKKISLDSGFSPDEMIAAGLRIFNGKGTCNICHAIGRKGNRGPDLANIQITAAGRKPGLTPRAYLLESLIEPAAFLVKGYGPLMPPMKGILTPGEIMVTVAFLESMGGEPGVTPDEVRAALAKSGGAPKAAPPAPAAVGAVKGNAGGDAARGKQAYLKNCMPCHGPDPAVDGPVGPKIVGASPALVEARLMRASYPPGYQPKRTTRLMQPMPQLAAQLADLAAYLNEEK